MAMNTKCFSKIELRYNQTAESLLISVYIRYDSQRRTLFDEINNLVFNIELPSAISVANPSYSVVELVDRLDSSINNCGFTCAVNNIVDNEANLFQFKNSYTPYTLKSTT